MKINELENIFLEEKINKADYISNMYNQKHDILFDYSKFIKEKDIQKIEIIDNKVIMTTRKLGIKMICNRYDERDIPIEIMNFGEYEKEDSNMIYHIVKDDDTVFDIGGNMGWYSIALSKIKKNLDIHTFEPIPSTYNSLKNNLELNKININLNNIGLSNKKQILPFYFYKECSGNASSAVMNEEKENIKIECQVDTLDNFFEEKALTKLDFIKCDVEGAELFTFQGAIKTLEKYKPIVFTEMLRKWSAKFNYHPNETLELFQSFGYRCFFTHNSKLKELKIMTEETIETNFFFLHKEKHIDLIKELHND